MDYRAIPDEHETAFDDVLVYAFSPERGPDYEPEGPDRPASFQPRGLYEDDGGDRDDPATETLAAVCGYYDFSARIRGGIRDVAGVSAVASPPEMRRRGLVRDLLGHVHRELRDADVAFAALWPFEYSFYRRLGYERIGEYARIEVAPEALRARVRTRRGRLNGSTPTRGRGWTQCTTSGRATSSGWTAARAGGAIEYSSRGRPTRTCTGGPTVTGATHSAAISSTRFGTRMAPTDER
ncbi:GNAT family N-acetyltransferase [Halobaculum halobium]|uniref:GNAT family N-acetyltransferase n=1 Tax=Halobaculum halobium TaxID=3032281 RepID=UPI00361546CD